MSGATHIDCVKKIIDEDNREIVLITYSDQNTLLFKLQINVQDDVPSPVIPVFSTIKCKNPTPCQCAVIESKCNFLEGLLNFMCNQKEDFHCNGLPQYQNGLKLDIESVFCPTVSNTPYPLLHLAAIYVNPNAEGEEKYKPLVVLINFLKEQNCLQNFINRPDYQKRTPLSLAFATGVKELIIYLLKNGADPFYGVDNENVIMPFIFTCIHYNDKIQTAIDCIRDYKENPNFDAFGQIKNYYYSPNGLTHSTQVEDSKDLENFKEDKHEFKEVYSKHQAGLSTQSTLDNERPDPASPSTGDNATGTARPNKAKTSQKCAFDGCDNIATRKCLSGCSKMYCEYHIDEHGC